MMGASLPEKGQDLRRRKNGRAIRPYPSLLSFEFIAAAAAAIRTVAAVATLPARTAVGASPAVATIPAVAVAAVVAAHHRRRAVLVRIYAQGHVADAALVDLGLAFDLGGVRARRFEV